MKRRTVGIFFQLTFFLIIIVNASNVVHFIQDIRINIFRLDQSVENSGGMCSAGQLDNILFAARVW